MATDTLSYIDDFNMEPLLSSQLHSLTSQLALPDMEALRLRGHRQASSCSPPQQVITEHCILI